MFHYGFSIWIYVKAFDTVDHTELFRALGHHGLDPAYIELLKRLYSGQKRSANGSRTFNILCGVRQGDVLSAIIFNCELENFTCPRRIVTRG